MCNELSDIPVDMFIICHKYVIANRTRFSWESK